MPLDGAYCNALLTVYWSVYQKLNHVSSVTSLCMHRWGGGLGNIIGYIDEVTRRWVGTEMGDLWRKAH